MQFWLGRRFKTLDDLWRTVRSVKVLLPSTALEVSRAWKAIQDMTWIHQLQVVYLLWCMWMQHDVFRKGPSRDIKGPSQTETRCPGPSTIHALCWSCFFQDPPFGSVGFVWMWTCQKFSKKSVSLKLEDFHWKRTDCTLWGNSNFRQETFMFWLRSPLATSWGRWLWVQYWASLQRWPWRQRWGMILAFSPCKKATALCIFTIVWELTLEVCDNSDGTTHLWPLMPLQRSRE